jgi:hypothetical protein
MRTRQFLLTAIAVLAIASLANANLYLDNFVCHDDGDGAIVMNPATLTNGGHEGTIPVYNLTMSGKQYDAPAHMLGELFSDSETIDPIVWITQTVENDTTFAWTDYHIAIGMDKAFTIGDSIHLTGLDSQYGIVAPADWTWTITQPVGNQLLPNGNTGWLGFVDYLAGTPIPIGIGNTGTFGLKTTFVGSVQFCTEQYPTPEPATLAILGLGGMALLRKRTK